MENKPLMVVQCPAGTRSGYGERSRDFVRALIELDKYDIKIVSTRWGATPMNALTEKDTDIVSRLLTQQLDRQPDIFVQISVPNEFQRMGKFNIGVTAGIETTICDASWIEGMNRMDLNLVSSEHAKKVFLDTKYNKQDQNTGQPLGTLQIEKPIEVVFEGIRLDKFKKDYVATPAVEEMFKDIKEDFAFLFVGHWLPGAFGEDRKNVGGLVKTFYESFKGKLNAPALILKTSGGTVSVMDREAIMSKINEIKASVDSKVLPNVYIAYGDFSEEEMNSMYTHPKVKAHVSFTRGEGYGRPLAEAALTGKPILASKWSGHMDFLNEEMSVLLDGKLTPIHPSAQWKGVLNEGSEWFLVDYGTAAAYMKDVYKKYAYYLEKSRKTYHHMKTNFSFDKMKERLDSILTARIPEFPKQVALKLPQLRKIELPKLKKIEA
jgi:glycosyltransferase involved in cell wall biosynthesis